MERFASGKTAVLVATSVIEVGIDVANATVMLVEGAERYGLSQLHQLRGRVGRGEHASHCILFADAGSELAQRRLEAIETERDGFKLAEVDLALRGEGEILGTRQHGLPRFRVAELPEDVGVLTEARREVIALRRAARLARGARAGAAARRGAPALRRRAGRADRGVAIGALNAGRRRGAQGPPPGGAAAAVGRRAADRRPGARGAVLDPRRRRRRQRARPLLRHRGARRSRRSRAAPAAPRWSTAHVSLARRNVARARSRSAARRSSAPTRSATCARSRRRFDLIFCDPPYRLADRLEAELDSLIPARLAEGGRLIVESAARRPLELGLPLLAERRYGDTLIRIHAGRSDERRAHGDLPGHLRPGHQRAPRHHRPGRERLRPGRRRRRQPADPQADRRCSRAEERRAFLERRDRGSGSTTSRSRSSPILLVEFAREHGATAIVKGLRAISDFEYEFEMNQLNRKLAPEIESVYIIASPDYSFLSSTGVKEMATFGGDVSDLVPPGVAEALAERLKR